MVESPSIFTVVAPACWAHGGGPGAMGEDEVLPCQIHRAYEDLQRLVAAPKIGVPERRPRFPWAEFKVSSLKQSLTHSIEMLYQDLVIGPLSETCLRDFFLSLAASHVFQDLWAGERRGPFLVPVPFVRKLLTLDEIQHGLSVPTGRKPCESALTLTDGVEFRCPISLPPIQSMPQMLQVLPLTCI